jgi:hypothetical protein
VIVAVGWGVLVNDGVEVDGCATAPHADDINVRTNSIDIAKLNF